MAFYPAMSTTPASPLSQPNASLRPCPVPSQRADRAGAAAPKHRVLSVVDPHGEDHAVLVADRHDILDGMAGDLRDQRLPHRAQFLRRLAHRAVLAGERPDDCRRRAGRGEPLALGRPRHRLHLRRIAGHAHVSVVGKPPAMQRVFLHGRHEEPAVRREGDANMRAFPFQEQRRALRAHEPQLDAVVAGNRDAQALGREGDCLDGALASEVGWSSARRYHSPALACGNRYGAARSAGERVDPLAGTFTNHPRRTVARNAVDRAVLAAGHQRRTVQRQRRAGDPAGYLDPPFAARNKHHRPVRHGECGRVADKSRPFDMGAGVDWRNGRHRSGGAGGEGSLELFPVEIARR